MEIVSEHRSFNGRQLRIAHYSRVLHCNMHFSLYLPPQEQNQAVPLLTWLSGLTCSDENFVLKAGAQRYAAQAGLALLTPDTSPRGEEVPDTSSDRWALGQGAGFYLNAIREPWNKHYRMEAYIVDELQDLMANSDFRLIMAKQGIFGHSMGGHGALTLGLKYPKLFASISAFSPICSPCTAPWGRAAFELYLGKEAQLWKENDSCELLLTKGYQKELLVDFGSNDPYLSTQLQPNSLQQACLKKNITLHLRQSEGYDHSYFFVASFVNDHISFHKQYLMP